MRKTYQFRIYPNKNSEVNTIRTLSTCRHLYNEKLAERKKQAELNRLKKTFDVFPWGKPEWINYSQVLQDAIKRVDRSFNNFFIGFGYPRFQGRNRYNSFTYTQSGFEIKDV